jgi:cytochrome c
LPALVAVLLWVAACGNEPRRSPGGTGSATLDDPRGAAASAGAEVYRRERCGRCHTLDRPSPAAGESILPGGPGDLTSRVGPDLGLEGHRHSDDWHYAHLYAPGLVVPGTRMPAHRHLFVTDPAGRPVPLKEAVDLVAFLQSLGTAEEDVWAAWRSRDPVEPRGRAGSAELQEGVRSLYARHCEACHGGSGDGRGPAAPLLLFPPRDFTAARYRFRSSAGGATDADLFRSITLGGGTGSAMPAFYWLAAEERRALVHLIRSFGPPGEPTAGVPQVPPPELANPSDPVLVAEGANLWVALACGSCHGADGRGLTREAAGAAWTDAAGDPVPRASDLTDPCAMRGGASPEAILRAVIAGTGGPMPSYADSLPGGRERSAIVAYILSLRTGGGKKGAGPRDP